VIVSEKIVNEFKRVIHHERFADRLKSLQTTAEEVTAYFINLSQFVPDPNNIPKVILEDPFDNIFLSLADRYNARLVVSGDRHLLNIEEFKGIHIVRPSEACRIIEELFFR
jgi:putative PIN family toxin of toxin-antitoxin system